MRPMVVGSFRVNWLPHSHSFIATLSKSLIAEHTLIHWLLYTLRFLHCLTHSDSFIVQHTLNSLFRTHSYIFMAFRWFDKKIPICLLFNTLQFIYCLTHSDSLLLYTLLITISFFHTQATLFTHHTMNNFFIHPVVSTFSFAQFDSLSHCHSVWFNPYTCPRTGSLS